MDFDDELEFMTLKEGILLLQEDGQFVDKRVSLVSEAGCNKSFETANFLSVVGCILNQMENSQLLFELVVSNNHSLKFQCNNNEEKQQWIKHLSEYTTPPKNKSRGISLPDVKVSTSPVHHRNFNQSAPSLVSTTVHDYNDDDQRFGSIQNLSNNSYDDDEEREDGEVEQEDEDESQDEDQEDSDSEEQDDESSLSEESESNDEFYYDYEKEKEKQLKNGNKSSTTVGTIKLTSSSNNIATLQQDQQQKPLKSYQFTEDESFIIELFPNVEVSVILDALEFCRGDRDEVIALLASQTRLSYQGDLNGFSPVNKKNGFGQHIKQQQQEEQEKQKQHLKEQEEQNKLKKELKEDLKQLELEEEEINKQIKQLQQQQQQQQTRPRNFKTPETYQKPNFLNNCNITLKNDRSCDSSENGSLEDEVSFENHHNQLHCEPVKVSIAQIEPSFVALNISNVSIVDNISPPSFKSYSTSSLPSTSSVSSTNSTSNVNRKSNWSYKPSTSVASSSSSNHNQSSAASSLSSSQERSLSSSQDHSLSSSQDRSYHSSVNSSYSNSPRAASSPNSLRSSQERPNTPTSWKPFTKSGAAWDLSIKINGFFQLDDHIEYRIHVISNSNEWFVFRRYNNFLLLDKKLKNLGIIDKKDIGLTLPPKKLKVASNQVAKARQEPLESYLVYLLSNYQGIFYNNKIPFNNNNHNNTILNAASIKGLRNRSHSASLIVETSPTKKKFSQPQSQSQSQSQLQPQPQSQNNNLSYQHKTPDKSNAIFKSSPNFDTPTSNMSQLNLSSQSCFSNNSSSAADFNSYIDAKLLEESNYYKNFNSNSNNNKEPIRDKEVIVDKENNKDNNKENNKENNNKENNNKENNNTKEVIIADSKQPQNENNNNNNMNNNNIPNNNNGNIRVKKTVFKNLLEFIRKPNFSVMFGFSPIYFVESLFIVMLIYLFSKFVFKEVSIYVVSIFAIYFVLYFDNRYQILNKLSSNNNSRGDKTENSNIDNNNNNSNSDNQINSDNNHKYNKYISSPEIAKDIKSRISFYENTSSSNLIGGTLSLSNVNSVNGTPIAASPAISNSSAGSSGVGVNGNGNGGGSIGNGSGLTKENSSSNLINNSNIMNIKTHTRSSSGGVSGHQPQIINRKSLPPEYYNQYFNYLPHEKSQQQLQQQLLQQQQHQQHSQTQTPQAPQTPQTPSSFNADDGDIVNISQDHDNSLFSEDNNLIDSDQDDQQSQSSHSSNSSSQQQLLSSNVDETKQELSQLENTNKVKSTITKFSKLSSGIEEKLDWALSQFSLSPSRSCHSVTVYGSSIVLIGGEGINENLVQFIDVERNLSISPKVTGGKVGPETIYSHDYCRVGNKFYLFGGFVGGKLSNKVYVLTIMDDSTVHWSMPRISGNLQPSARYGHTFTRYGNKFLLFGGNDGEQCLNDLHSLDPETMSWSSITSAKGTPPIERFGHTSTILGEKLIVFGGSSGSNKNGSSTVKDLNDMHVLSLCDGYQWQQVTFNNLSGEIPCERSFHCSTRVGRNIVMVAGKAKDGTPLKDVWVLSYRMQWSKVTGTQFTPRSHFGLIKNGSKLFVLGGKGRDSNGATTILDDVWFVNTVTLPITSSVTLINYPDIKIDKEIGKGHFSKVLKGNWKGKDVAVKKLNSIKDKGREEMMTEFKAEVELLGSLQHPNLVTCYGYSLNPMCIVMEFLPTGNLFELIHSKEQKLDSALILQIAFDIARGMAHLHSRNIIHRDLKSSNLLMDKHFNIKIADLGIARETSFTQTMTTIGTVAWTAPEILRHENYNQKADVYSYGIVLWELLTGEEPYEGIPPMNAGILVASKGLRPELPENCDPNWKKLVVWCWSEDPNKRPSFEEVTNYLTKTF
ncbi:hypothetical protein DICPUDRAFT_94884 [Dictyostelium purpureum]|uniref:Non-specific serine/threonine protein kinase n=1 Tax=Dictyostelium purpureum TaxID=5786 RepID=F0ZPQ0_DICPU|nr:uncharacterized protein DICPUDRAFT_94884 [Dictyostelium purpureum]EGC34101.1 hypothetical protein DICPUDRAFT_94884 [Dictyostelium purpureum]|eukprot:XP_003289394.1 hypothetical protein DICPUDRAFT_94884 [Dictyostelium purpureum]